ncbi:MAG: hypothetical protein EOM90_01825 [Alphaproteobacteria bacterium]|nr:hypothetical protein [Alphaproteobacteria bacterium]
MNAEEKTTPNQNNTQNQKETTFSATIPTVETINKNGNPPGPKNDPPNNRKNKFIYWISRKKNQRHFGFWLNIFTLISFIVFSWIQSCKTQRSLDIATQSINYTRKSDSITRLSDSFNRIFTQRTADTSYRLAKTGVDLSKQSVAFTKRSDSASEEFRKIELRAYLSIKEMIINDFLKDKTLTGSIIIENVGKTPAKKVRFIWGPKYNKNFLYHADFERIKKFDTAYGVGLHSGVPLNVGIKIDDTTPLDSLSIVKKKTKFYIFGIIFYEDIFGERHANKFAMVYDPVAKKFYYEDVNEPEK